jgi:hypothetical protein
MFKGICSEGGYHTCVLKVLDIKKISVKKSYAIRLPYIIIVVESNFWHSE